MPVLILSLSSCMSDIVTVENSITGEHEIADNGYQMALPWTMNDSERIAIGFYNVEERNKVVVKVGYITSNTGIIKSIGFNVGGAYYEYDNEIKLDEEYKACNEIGICTTHTTPHAYITLDKQFINIIKRTKKSIIIVNMKDGQSKAAILKNKKFGSGAFDLLMEIQ